MNKWLMTAMGTAFFLSACGGSQSAQTPSASASVEASSAVVDSNKAPVYRVSTNAEFAPFESMDEKQEIHGFDVDLLKAIAKQGGFEVVFEHKLWDSLIPALKNGDTDIVASGVTITDERKQVLDFTDPYYTIKQVVLVAPNKNVVSVNDVKKLQKVGVVVGHTGDYAAQKLMGATSPHIARFETLPLLIKEVENGGVDAAISDSAVVAHYIKNNSDKGFKMLEVPDFDIENYGFAVNKGNTELLNKLNDGLKKVKESGEYASIESKYFAQ